MLRVFAEHPDVVLVYSDAVITDRELQPTDRVQSKEGPQGHIKSGQRWSLQPANETGLRLGCFTPPPPEEASLFSCANSVDHI